MGLRLGLRLQRSYRSTLCYPSIILWVGSVDGAPRHLVAGEERWSEPGPVGSGENSSSWSLPNE